MQMKRKLLIILTLLFLLGVNFQSVFAATYRFQVTDLTANVIVNTDGSISVEYTLDFLNDKSADPIDFVDIGLPNDSYTLNTIKAEVNGQPISDIQKSDYVTHGVALGLGKAAIPAGAKGQVHVLIPTVKNVLYPADQQTLKDYASLVFSPNYFGSEYCYGKTNYTFTLFLPPGMTADEPRYFTPKGWPGATDPYSEIDQQNRILYRWTSPDANNYTEYQFGAGFPAKLVPAGAIVKENPKINFNFEDLCCWGFALMFGGFFVLGIYGSIWGAKKRKLQYLPPKIAIEGHGIKRGLTAVEAAVLMEQPMDKVMTMILFSLVKKGAATVTSREPLTLESASPLPEELFSYENDFLAAFQKKSKGDRKTALQDTIINLVKSLTEKMRGFSRKETVAYYQDIMKRAWDTVQQADTPEVKMQKYDEVMGWTMLDKDFDSRTRDTFGSGPVFVPMWWGRFDPGYGHGSMSTPVSSPSSSSGSGGGSISLPTLPGSDFAVSMATGIQSFASNVVGDVTSFTDGITQKTNPVPPPSTYKGGGGHGGGCACACACAGCACACAGGGR
jgi:hypothetical protein